MSDVDNSPVADNNPAPVAPPQGGEAPATTQANETETSADTAVPGDPAEPKRDRKVEKRISRLTQQREAAVREAGYWRGVAESSRTPQGEYQPPAEPQPQQQTRPAPTAAEVRSARMAMERITEAGEEIEDFDDVMEDLTSDNLPVTQPMVEFLLATKKPAEMARWMTKNAKEINRIAMLPRELAYDALKEAESSLTTKPPPRTTNTPPPPPTVNGRASPNFNPATASMDDYAKHWQERKAARSR